MRSRHGCTPMQRTRALLSVTKPTNVIITAVFASVVRVNYSGKIESRWNEHGSQMCRRRVLQKHPAVSMLRNAKHYDPNKFKCNFNMTSTSGCLAAFPAVQ